MEKKLIFLLMLTITIPGCCWTRKLKRCYNCSHCGNAHNLKKQVPVTVD